MLGLKAKAGLLFFVSAGIFAGVVVFGNTVARDKINSVAEKEVSNVAQKATSLEDLIGETVSIIEETAVEAVPTVTPQKITNGNLTESVASLIGKNIVDKNPEGPVGDNLTLMGADGMADAAITESLKHFNPAYFTPEILRGDITVDDAQTVTAYRAAVAKITTETESQTLPADASVKDQMTTYAKNYAVAASGLYALPTPSALVAEHMQAIRIALGKRRILEAAADYENDPIYAMLALKLWDTLK